MEKRTFNTEVRKNWNEKIANLLKAIDLHNELYFKTFDNFHKEQAEYLRKYVRELKDWIIKEENNI